MMHPVTRVAAAVVLALAAASTGAGLSAQRSAQRPAATPSRESKGPHVEISFSAGAHAGPVTGMVYLAISRDNRMPPIQQTDTTGAPLFSRYVEQLEPGRPVTLGPEDRGHPVASLRDIPAGEYWVQPFVNIYTRFSRAD